MKNKELDYNLSGSGMGEAISVEIFICAKCEKKFSLTHTCNCIVPIFCAPCFEKFNKQYNCYGTQKEQRKYHKAYKRSCLKFNKINNIDNEK